MSENIFVSNAGIAFEKTAYKNGRCKVVVKGLARNNILSTYRFKNIPEFKSRYLSWENLNCCGGWECDETYLYTAVQKGKKLFAAITVTMFDNEYVIEHAAHNLPERKHMQAIMEQIKRELPSNCIMGREDADRRGYGCTFEYYFICRTGTIGDYININDVLLAYERLGIIIDDESKAFISEYCATTPLEAYAKNKNPLVYFADPKNGAELIITGLLLGYPIESTAWFLERDGYFPIVK